MAYGTVEMLERPCVDCGRITGNYCDFCLAANREPDEEWADGQHTPLCTYCDKDFGRCHFCRKQLWVRRPAWDRPPSPPAGVSPGDGVDEAPTTFQHGHRGPPGQAAGAATASGDEQTAKVTGTHEDVSSAAAGNPCGGYCAIRPHDEIEIERQPAEPPGSDDERECGGRRTLKQCVCRMLKGGRCKHAIFSYDSETEWLCGPCTDGYCSCQCSGCVEGTPRHPYDKGKAILIVRP